RVDGGLVDVGTGPGGEYEARPEEREGVPVDRARLPGAREERQAARAGEVRPRDGGRRGAVARPPEDREGPPRRVLERGVHRRQGGRDAPGAGAQPRLRRAGAGPRRGEGVGLLRGRRVREGGGGGQGAGVLRPLGVAGEQAEADREGGGGGRELPIRGQGREG